MAEVGILIIDDDIVSQRALKNILDSEGWRVRIVPLAAHAMGELASGEWNLVIVNIALANPRGPLFAILRELAQAESLAPEVAVEAHPDALPVLSVENQNGKSRKSIRVLFLIPPEFARHTLPILEREGLPYLLKPYHLHDFLEKVSELLVECGAIADPIRSMTTFSGVKKRRREGSNSRVARRGTMFASREDYQMSEEEMAEFERQEEEDRKKREKEQKNREHLG